MKNLPIDAYHHRLQNIPAGKAVWNRDTGEWELMEPLDDLASAPRPGMMARMRQLFSSIN
jgi:hypothetical protein